MRHVIYFGLIATVAVGCFEGKTVKNIKAEGQAASSEDLTSAEIETCLGQGGTVSKVDEKLVCNKSKTNEAGLCSAKEVEDGVEITCADKDPVLVKHGDGCSVELVPEGVELTCGKGNLPLLIRHGSSCVVEAAEGGANISCPGSQPVFVADGTNGVDGTSCTVTPSADGAIISCGEGADQVAIRHGESAQGIHTTEVIDPCGASDGFDEILLRMSDGTLVAYFEDGKKNRFLTVLNPAIHAGRYMTTDAQRCVFRVHENGDVTW